jgi:hypothetical protein
VYEAVVDRRLPAQGRLERDQVIRLTSVGAAEKCPHALRRIEVYDPDKDETLVFLTNHLAFGATTIAAIYKDRWQIELCGCAAASISYLRRSSLSLTQSPGARSKVQNVQPLVAFLRAAYPAPDGESYSLPA